MISDTPGRGGRGVLKKGRFLRTSFVDGPLSPRQAQELKGDHNMDASKTLAKTSIALRAARFQFHLTRCLRTLAARARS